MLPLSFRHAYIQPLAVEEAQRKNITVAVLRLDVVHPIVSGNKWYKLKAYLAEAATLKKTTLITFGGAFSNHLLATAAACRMHGLKSIGVIRGERPPTLSFTLQQAQQEGMQLFFVSRDDYRKRVLPQDIKEQYNTNGLYIIPEGGYGEAGVRGAKGILTENNTAGYTHICAAVGTGTMLAGLIEAARPHQTMTGISVLKNNHDAERAVTQLLSTPKKQFNLLHDYHFGGYAKYTPALIRFMNHWHHSTGVPTDFVYTAKLFYAVRQLIMGGYFVPDTNLLVVHSGGLQGNRSLPDGMLVF